MKKLFDLAMATGNLDENLQNFNSDFQLNNFSARQQPLHALSDKEYLKDIIGENIRVKLAKLLIDFNKVDINSRDKNANTSLHIAVESEFPELVKLLVRMGCEKNCLNLERQTPLHVAVLLNIDFTIVETLLDKETNIDLPDTFGFTIYQYAVTNLDNSMYDFKGASYNSMKIMNLLLNM